MSPKQNTQLQPIAKYMVKLTYFFHQVFLKKASMVMPTKVQAQRKDSKIVLKFVASGGNTQPTIGVYVPAMSKYIAEWSSTLRSVLNRVKFMHACAMSCCCVAPAHLKTSLATMSAKNEWYRVELM